MPRRSRQALEAAVAAAAGPAARAQACYDLALFHDNNSREAEAIPLYREALRLGLPTPVAAEAHAWLASSLMKTGALDDAMRHAGEARRRTSDPALLAFLEDWTAGSAGGWGLRPGSVAALGPDLHRRGPDADRDRDGH